MRRMRGFLVLLVLLLAASSCGGAAGLSEGGAFATPEEAILALADGVRRADFEGAIACMDISNRAERYDLEASADYMRTYSVGRDYMPSMQYAAYAPINEMAMRSEYGLQLRGFVMSLLLFSAEEGSVRLAEDGTLEPQGETTQRQLIALFAPERLQGLRLTELYRYDAERYRDAHLRERMLARGAIYGYTDELVYAAVYEMDGRRYAHSCAVRQYADGWRVGALHSSWLSMSYAGNAVPIDEFTDTMPLVEPDFVRVWQIDAKEGG